MNEKEEEKECGWRRCVSMNEMCEDKKPYLKQIYKIFK